MKAFQTIGVFLLSLFIVSFHGIINVSAEESLAGEETVEVKKLSLEGVDIVDMDVLELSFGVDIDDTQEKDFIVKSLPLGDEVSVEQIMVDGEKVLLSIGEDFETDKQYEVIIISLYGTDGSTIVSGIDGAIEFSAPDMTQFDNMQEVEIDLNAALEEKEALEEAERLRLEQEAAEEIQSIADAQALEDKLNEEKRKTESENVVGKSIDQSELDKNVIVAAGKVEDLPETGPEHIFFVFLAMILGGLLIHVKSKKI